MSLNYRPPAVRRAAHPVRPDQKSPLVVGLVVALTLGFDYLEWAYRQSAGAWMGDGVGTGVVVTLEVILIPLGIAAGFMRATGRRWSSYGLFGPRPTRRQLQAALAVAALAAAVWHRTGSAPAPLPPSAWMPYGGPGPLLLYGAVHLASVLGEELLVRGFLLNETAALLGGGRAGRGAALVLLAALFATGHAYQGFGAMFGAGATTLLFGILYLGAHRNLWIPVLAHGLARGATMLLA